MAMSPTSSSRWGNAVQAVLQDGQSCFHREGVQRLFPRERGYEAYLGLPIVGSDGRVLGHLAFFDRAPRGDEMLLGSVYRIFLARAAPELRAQAGAQRIAARGVVAGSDVAWRP